SRASRARSSSTVAARDPASDPNRGVSPTYRERRRVGGSPRRCAVEGSAVGLLRILRSVPGGVVTTALALGVAGGGLGLRAAGALEALELGAYDRLLRWTRPTVEDSRVVLVRIGERDIERHGHPLSDETLARTLRALVDAGPRAIGVDL